MDTTDKEIILPTLAGHLQGGHRRLVEVHLIATDHLPKSIQVRTASIISEMQILAGELIEFVYDSGWMENEEVEDLFSLNT